jgi:hypothetical protein
MEGLEIKHKSSLVVDNFMAFCFDFIVVWVFTEYAQSNQMSWYTHIITSSNLSTHIAFYHTTKTRAPLLLLSTFTTKRRTAASQRHPPLFFYPIKSTSNTPMLSVLPRTYAYVSMVCG